MRTTVILLTLTAPFLAAQTDVDFFDDSIMQEIRLDIAPADWATLRANYLGDDYYPVTFHWRYKGQLITAQGVGIKSRGFGSRSPVKPNLHIDFNHYPAGKKFLGLSGVDTKSNNQDASEVKERAVMKLFDRMGLPASRETHARVYINDVYFGVQLLIELDKSPFLTRNFGESSGDVFKWIPVPATFHWDWNPVCAKNQVACGTTSDNWNPVPLTPDSTPFDMSSTIDMFHQGNALADADFEKGMGNFLDLKLWLLHNALENFVADFDCILGDVFGMNNFHLYRFDKTTFHQFMVWDKDQAYSYYKREIFQNASQNVLMRRLLAIPARNTQYLEGLYKAVVMGGQAGGWMDWENQYEFNQIKQAVYDDPSKQLIINGVTTNVTNAQVDQQMAMNVSFLQQRAGYVLSNVTLSGFQPGSAIKIADGGVLNAASNAAGQALVPGSLATIYGAGLANTTFTVTTGPLPTVAGGVSVSVNGFFAPLLYVSPTQINIQVPWELGLGDGTSPFTVLVYGATTKGTRANSPVNATFSNMLSAPIKAYAPGVFLARTGDGTVVSGGSPAGAGDVIVVYATGLGPVSIPQPTGVLTPAVLSNTTQVPSVTIGGVAAQVQFSGLTPGTAGVYQINLVVPAGVPAGTAPLVVTIGGESSPAYSLATR